jgi:hypothetical protein
LSSWEPFQKEKGRAEVSEKEKKLRKMATMEDKENMRICQRMNSESNPNIKYSHHASEIWRGAIISVSPKTEGAYGSDPEIKWYNLENIASW